MLILSLFALSTIQKAEKTDPNYTIWGNLFISQLTEIKCKIWRVTVLKNFLPPRNIAVVYFKDVSAQLKSICYLGPHAWYIK